MESEQDLMRDLRDAFDSLKERSQGYRITKSWKPGIQFTFGLDKKGPPIRPAPIITIPNWPVTHVVVGRVASGVQHYRGVNYWTRVVYHAGDWT